MQIFKYWSTWGYSQTIILINSMILLYLRFVFLTRNLLDACKIEDDLVPGAQSKISPWESFKLSSDLEPSAKRHNLKVVCLQWRGVQLLSAFLMVWISCICDGQSLFWIWDHQDKSKLTWYFNVSTHVINITWHGEELQCFTLSGKRLCYKNLSRILYAKGCFNI